MATLGGSEPELLLKAAEQDPQKIAVLGQRMVREITEKFQAALQNLHSMDLLSEQTSSTQEQEKLLSFEQQVENLYSLVYTVRSAYEKCLEAGSKKATTQSASLVDERDRLLKELHQVSGEVQTQLEQTRQLLWTVNSFLAEPSTIVKQTSQTETPGPGV